VLLFFSCCLFTTCLFFIPSSASRSSFLCLVLSHCASPPPAQVAQGFFFSRPSSFSCRDFSVKLGFCFLFLVRARSVRCRSCFRPAPSVSLLLLSRTVFLLLAASFAARSRFSFLSAGERPSALKCKLGPDPANRACSQLLRFRSAPGLSVPAQPKIFPVVFPVFTGYSMKCL
jgi:hypothetical protein